MTFYSARLFRALRCSDAENISPLWAQILGNHTEFQRVATLLQDTVDFDTDVNASVFETNIRGKVTSLRGWISQSIISKYLEKCVHKNNYFCITVKYDNAHYCRAKLNISHFLFILGKLTYPVVLVCSHWPVYVLMFWSHDQSRLQWSVGCSRLICSPSVVGWRWRRAGPAPDPSCAWQRRLHANCCLVRDNS